MLEKFKIEIKYLRRSVRATIRVFPENLIKLTVPFRLPKSEINRILIEKTDWILEKHKILESQQREAPISFIAGAELPYLGKKIKISIIEGAASVALVGEYLIVATSLLKMSDAVYIKNIILKWYQSQAFELISEKVAEYSAQIGVTARSIKLKNYKSRWGACSSKAELVFNWQIICFKEPLFNYVVAHEVSHIKELNHSPRFYRWLSQLGFEQKVYRREFKNLKNIF